MLGYAAPTALLCCSIGKVYYSACKALTLYLNVGRSKVSTCRDNFEIRFWVLDFQSLSRRAAGNCANGLLHRLLPNLATYGEERALIKT